METAIDEGQTYQYYTIVKCDSLKGQENVEHKILHLGFDSASENVQELTINPSSNESLEAQEVFNDLESILEEDTMKSTILNDLEELSVIEDEHYNSIDPMLLNLNQYEVECNKEQVIEEYTQIDISSENLQFSDDSNTAYNLLNFENPSSEKDLHSSEIEFQSGSGRFQCISVGCDKTYGTSYHLSAHMKTHFNPKPFNCPLEGCNKTFSSNFTMKNHVKIHTGERPYVCNFCSKDFKTSGDALRHTRIHTGIKPFTCPIEGCNRSFTTSNIRKVHVRSHTGEKPYICSHLGCGKAFSSSANHKTHQRIHSGEKPFVCSVKGCKKRFTEYSTMYKHMVSEQYHTRPKILPEDLQFDF